MTNPRRLTENAALRVIVAKSGGNVYRAAAYALQRERESVRKGREIVRLERQVSKADRARRALHRLRKVDEVADNEAIASAIRERDAALIEAASLRAAIEQARAEEREACAQVADAVADRTHEYATVKTATRIAEWIRNSSHAASATINTPPTETSTADASKSEIGSESTATTTTIEADKAKHLAAVLAPYVNSLDD